ncbi:MAG: iron-sulfur cluster biosynthesis transcriptional regulator SufR [Geitlerinemataceae cyanobacterium]
MKVNSQNPSTKEDILKYLLKHGRARAQELAEVLAVTPQAVRRHLKDLEVEGAIEYQSVREGMGRPQHVYQLTAAGRAHFPHRYDDFALSLLDTMAETVGKESVGKVLGKQWEQKARDYRDRIGGGSVRERLYRLVALRRDEGYMAEVVEVDADGEAQFGIAEYNCAISNVAESYPTVCGHELLMFIRVLPDCKVERTHWMIDGENRCGYSIRERALEIDRAADRAS